MVESLSDSTIYMAYYSIIHLLHGNVFHVSMLKKYIPDASHVLQPQSVQISEDLSYEEKPVKILDRKAKTLRNKEIQLVKVLWRNQKVEEATWEREDEMKERYPSLF